VLVLLSGTKPKTIGNLVEETHQSDKVAAVPTDAARMKSGRFSAWAYEDRQLLHSRNTDRSFTVPYESPGGIEAGAPHGNRA